jgi:hypothetical protein
MQDTLIHVHSFLSNDRDLISLLSTSKEFHLLKNKFLYTKKKYSFEETFVDLWYARNIKWIYMCESVECLKKLPLFVTKVYFLGFISQELRVGDIPDHVKDIHLGNIDSDLVTGMLPKCTKNIVFDSRFTKSVRKGSIPFGTEKVSFDLVCADVKQGAIPKTVLSVVIPIDMLLGPKILPDSVKKLTVTGPAITAFAPEINIPSSVTHLYIDTETFPFSIPKSVTHLYITNSFFGTINTLNVPPTVKHLILSRRYQKYNTKTQIPVTLKSITLHKSVCLALPPIPKITFY